MKRLMFAALLAGLFCCCSNSNLPNYNVLENDIYDIPAKSQVSIRLELADSTYTKAQVKELCEMMVRISNEKEMKFHPIPTHIWIYIYKPKTDWQKDSGSWIAMYGKAGKEDKGEYTYR